MNGCVPRWSSSIFSKRLLLNVEKSEYEAGKPVSHKRSTCDIFTTLHCLFRHTIDRESAEAGLRKVPQENLNVSGGSRLTEEQEEYREKDELEDEEPPRKKVNRGIANTSGRADNDVDEENGDRNHDDETVIKIGRTSGETAAKRQSKLNFSVSQKSRVSVKATKNGNGKAKQPRRAKYKPENIIDVNGKRVINPRETSPPFNEEGGPIADEGSPVLYLRSLASTWRGPAEEDSNKVVINPDKGV
ncbi:hypothetical protein BDN72DRAFT_482457 [Pluteus cervinus]|uniref:Uncharacterized protein n=1 Tax=Pluteus cervinus TaxID=181527 RepID=A0ACD3AZM8_9AGAR|nr:hypothetical protein BDN72DRAFT_482457 [Pluteus cervinus]